MISGGFALKAAVVLSASTLLLFAANTAIIGTYHIFLALSNTGFMPRVISLRSAKFHSPHVAISIATGVPVAVIIATRGELALLGEMYAFGLLGAFVFSSMSLDLIRWNLGRRDPAFWIGVLTTGMLGVFVALDLFLFYVFWEVMLIPMYFIIGIWGGANRLYAAIKFFIYTMAGSLLMLVAIVTLVWRVRAVTGYLTFSYDLLLQHAGAVGALAPWLFAAFAIAFAIKVPIFPFHTWLPDAHVEAPTAGSVLLAAVMLKIGTYGFLRFAVPFFPHVALSPTVSAIMVVLAVIGVIYGALVAMVQPDIKKLVAYSSVSHLGFVMLGIWGGTLQSVQGSLMVMISHGFSTGALFLLIGMIYERRHTRLIADYGGIARVVPIFSVIFTVVALSSIGLPGLNGFIGEFLVLLGSFGAYPVATVLATTGVIFAAAYLLWALQRMIFNRLDKPENEAIADLGRRELALMAPLLIGIVWLGLYPAPVLKRMESASRRFVELTQPARTTSPVAVQGASVEVGP